MRFVALASVLAFVFSAAVVSEGGTQPPDTSESNGEQILSNPWFENPGHSQGAVDSWEGPVPLEGETAPSMAELLQQTGYEEQYGGFVAYLKYRSTEPDGWAGLVYEQTADRFGEVTGPGDLCLVYRIRYQYGSGVGHASHNSGLVEVELRSGDEVYRLRYLHPREGELPDNTLYTAYVDAGDPGYRTWASHEHDLDADIAGAFPELKAYTVSAVRIGALIQKESSEETALYWLFDKVELVRGDSQTSVCS